VALEELANRRRPARIEGGVDAAGGRGANSCAGSSDPNSRCMPSTGSQTDIAPKVSPW
jgi:hypothetical protein